MSDFFGEPGERVLKLADRTRVALAILAIIGGFVGGALLLSNLYTPD